MWREGWKEGGGREGERERERERSDPTNLRGEWFIGVELFRIGDCSVVDLVHDVLQQGLRWRGIYTGGRLTARPLFVCVCGSLDHHQHSNKAKKDT